jgi:hypothetical protein
MTEREQFEVWFDNEYPISGDCGRIKYRESSVRDLMVDAWLASRRAALEEAAAFMDKRADGFSACGNHTADTMARIYKSEADAIRALYSSTDAQ